MGKIYENDCCQCAAPGYPCDGRHKHVPHYYCDVCGEEHQPEDLFEIDGDMVCESCAEENISYRELLEDVYGTVC